MEQSAYKIILTPQSNRRQGWGGSGLTSFSDKYADYDKYLNKRSIDDDFADYEWK